MLNFDDDVVTPVQTTTATPAKPVAPPSASHVADYHAQMNEQGTPVNDLAAQMRAHTGRVRAEDKRVINGGADVNQLVPFKYN
jgi:ribonucleoside-diphosphate reductase beta chain